jgi:hypothetical protein
MTTIFTMTHKKFCEPENKSYVPLHVGKNGKADLGYLGDDTGDSISALNCYYGELTGVYWVWKNYSGCENIGICHYRRFFVNSDKKLMTSEEYDEILSEYDIIMPKIWTVEYYNSYWDAYADAHGEEQLIEEANVIKELYPEDYSVFCSVMNGKENYFGNLMVTSRELYNEYCEWLFPIFVELSKRINPDKYDEYHRRVYGFLSEQLLMVWVKKKNLKIYECDVMLTDEKAETKELKLAVRELLKVGHIDEARELFYGVLKVRPDIPLELSDMKREIFIIEHILYICSLEKQNDQKGMLEYNNDLFELIKHYRKIVECLKDMSSPASREYFKSTYVTDIAVEVITRNQSDTDFDWDKIRRQYYELQE